MPIDHSIRMRYLTVLVALAACLTGIGFTGVVPPALADTAARSAAIDADDMSWSEEILRVEGAIRAPVKIHAPAPVYTEVARKERLQGTVVVETVIDENGDVVAIRLLEGQPLGLSAEAMSAIARWRFEPATLKGEPVKVYYNLTINFRLE